MTKHVADVAVIGAGALGLLSAFELVSRGRRVMVFHDERACPPASWAGGGILSPLFPWRYPDAVTRLTRHAVSDYQRLARELEVDWEVQAQGMLVFTDEDEVVRAWAHRHDIACERRQQGWYFPDMGSVRNSRLLTSLRAKLEALGVRFHADRAVALKEEGEQLAVVTGGASYIHDQVVVAAGAWSAALLSPWGVRLPVAPVKGQMLLWDLGRHCPESIWLGREGYFIPRSEGLCLFGSTIEPHFDTSLPTREGYETLCERAAALMPKLANKTPLAVWAGLRPGNTRSEPYIFPVDVRQRLWVNTGHYRNGLVAAPASARLLAQWMCGETLAFDPTPYAAP